MPSGPAQNRKLVQEFAEQFNSSDFRRVRDVLDASDRAAVEERLGRFGEIHARLIDPEVEIDFTDVPGFAVFVRPGGRARGLAAWAEFWREWFDAWEANEVVHSAWEAEDDWVIAHTHSRLRGRASGAEVEFSNFQLWRLREGQVTAFSIHPTHEAALAAAARPLG
jgi:hypothetical protein